ncbi:MAG TPA: TonB family protein [Thermoanaerobaculia bacterium]|nr:TonB family protein [Thermoanaerobaculia bacterium]
MSLLHGSFEEKYEVLAKLRQGGMGAVYKVRHRLLDELRAIKVVRSWAVGSEEATARFLQEARVASRLRHPNLAVLHDFAVDPEGGAYLVSEYIDGWTFREILRRQGPPPLSLGLEMARQALKALGALHRSRIVHRDVSPDNLMLTRDVDGLPVVKLIDLGIAKALEESLGATDEGVFLGKPRYASPEQFGASPADERSDLYSFGVVLYELLTGRCPISGHDPLSLMAGHLNRPPLGFEESDPEGRIPPDLRKLLLDALEKRPEDRVPTAEDFAAALAGIQVRYPVFETDLQALFAVPAAAGETAIPEDTEAGEATAEPSGSLYLRATESETTRSGALPLHLAKGGPPIPPAIPEVDEITWGSPTVPPPVTPESSPALFRLATATAALLLLFVVARAFWHAAPQAPAKAPEWAAAPHVPSPPAPTPAPPLPVLPTVPQAAPQEVEKTAALPAEPEAPVRQEPPAAREPQPQPAPKVAETRPRRASARPVPPRPVPAKHPARPSLPAPAPSVALARRAPQLWEEGPQPPGLLKPGPGVEEPVPLDLPRFAYPSAAHGTGLRADVRLALLVDERGKVIDARVREGAPPNLGFAETALAAAKRIPFQPATRYDVPGKMWTEMILEFTE